MAQFSQVMGNYTNYRMELGIEQVSQNIQGNYSTVYWEFRMIRQIAAGSGAWGSAGWNVDIRGNGYSGTIGYDFRSSERLVVANGYTNIPHDNDGSGSLYASASWPYKTYGMAGGTVSGSMGLSKIPRASTNIWVMPGVTEPGWEVEIRTNRASTAFTHTVEYTFGSLRGTIGTGVGDSVKWTPPYNLLTMIPNAPSGTGAILVHTYSNGSHIGSGSSPFTLNAPAAIGPSIDTLTVSEANSLVESQIGAFVQGVSSLRATLSGVEGKYGSGIASMKIVADSHVINGSSGTTGILVNSGALNVVGTAVDTRGRQVSKTNTVNVLPYSPPRLLSVTFARATSGGANSEEGTYIKASMNLAVQSLLVGGVQKNNLRYRVLVRARGTTSWTVRSDNTIASVAYNSYVLVGPYSIESSWETRVELYDKFNTVAQEGTLATAQIFMHWGGKGQGLGVGKFWERGGIDVLGEIFHLDGVSVAMPIGNIMMTARNVAPPGWLLCQGQVLNIAQYRPLYAAIGTTFGGNGSTTFQLPDFRARVPVGLTTSDVDHNTMGKLGGSKTHSHQHISTGGLSSNSVLTVKVGDGSLNAIGNYSFNTVVSGGILWGGNAPNGTYERFVVTSTAVSSMSPFITVNYLIKT